MIHRISIKKIEFDKSYFSLTVADPAGAVRALDRVPWDDLITPANLTTMREVPSELQGDLLEAMRDILKNLNGALEGPEVEYER